MGQHLVIGLLAAAAQPPVAAPAPPPAATPPANSSDAPPPVAPAPPTPGQARTFTPADFARFAPRTALEMLTQVPGFSIQQQSERRGLGQATANVILNGERFSGKSNDVVAELGRIAASKVVRIEIVDGATLDIPGLSGQVANIVTAGSSTSGSFRWRPEVRVRRLPALLDRGEVSVNGKLGKTDYTLALSNQSRHNGNYGPEVVFRPDGTVIDRRDEVLRIIERSPRLNGRLRRATPGGTTWNLNASVAYNRLDQDEVSEQRGSIAPDRVRRLFEDRERPGYEVGGDYELPAFGGKLKFIGLRRAEHTEYSQLLTFDFLGNARPATADRYTQVSDEAETIARTEFRWKGGKADFQVSLEGAVNALDFAADLFSRDAAGVFQPVPFPGSDDKVEERRAEAILSYGRPLTKNLTLQLSGGAEYSRLSQQAGAGAVREFVRPKGQAALAWKPRADLDIALKLERRVGQLSFFDFVASRNIGAETGNAGNLELVPPQSWDVEVQGTRNLGVWGTTTLRAYVNFISDIVDVVPIGATGQSPGNIDSALRYGVQWTSTANFDPWGWKGARLDLDIRLQRSRLTDPLTGFDREINESLHSSVDIAFRRDIPKTDWAYGFGLDAFTLAPGFRTDQRFQVLQYPAGLNLFVENKDVYGLTVRANLFGLTHVTEGFDREFYNGRRTNDLLFTESRRRKYGLIFSLDVRGTF